MNQDKAFSITIRFAFERGMKEVDPHIPVDSMRFKHIEDMYLRIRSAADAGKPYAPDKLGRWLGWAQAAVVSSGCATLDDMKQINVSCADDDIVVKTPEEFTAEIKQYIADDAERDSALSGAYLQIYALSSMMKLLKELGYSEAVEAYEAVCKYPSGYVKPT